MKKRYPTLERQSLSLSSARLFCPIVREISDDHALAHHLSRWFSFVFSLLQSPLCLLQRFNSALNTEDWRMARHRHTGDDLSTWTTSWDRLWRIHAPGHLCLIKGQFFCCLLFFLRFCPVSSTGCYRVYSTDAYCIRLVSGRDCLPCHAVFVSFLELSDLFVKYCSSSSWRQLSEAVRLPVNQQQKSES